MDEQSDGGLAVALTKPGLAKGFGINVDLASDGLPPEFVLFGEDASRVVISCDPDHVSRIKQVAEKYGLLTETIRRPPPNDGDEKWTARARFGPDF